ncbi:hypothetical protein GOBAR_AA21214 [Gossypium barbadense]|uniref:Major facilitator superfamily (MFS) profile domain-containing protein n=1 Tax=Gossypium barbadense TaxID=3634 RepID=A0A2P5X801_GOSBA|nr:hypothetical protein GOBAR_AA21214 [Gossypium barbadense]
MADVVVDAMIAEAVRFEKASFAGDLQSLSWLSMAFGGVCGSLLGGYALTNLEIDIIFLLFSILPAIQLFSCGLVEESSMGGEVLSDFSISSDSHHLNGKANDLDEDGSLEKKSNVSARKRKKGQKKSKKTQLTGRKAQTPSPGKGKSLPLLWFQSLKYATYNLCRAFKQPMILRPMAWFFLAHVTVPNLSTVMFYYQTEFLKLEASFLGTVRVIGWLGLMLGTFTYNQYLKKMKLRRILALTHIGLAFLNLFDVILVSRTNVAFGVSDKTLVLCGSALSDAVNQFSNPSALGFRSFVWTAVSYQLKDRLKLSPSVSQFVFSVSFFPWSIKPIYFMPFLILSGQLCPPGIEGTLFALFMSINNFGSTVGSFVGAGLASILNISSGSFDNLLLGINIQLFCTFIPVVLLFLIPKEATGIAS